jgi:PAS domain S-box-containing protein
MNGIGEKPQTVAKLRWRAEEIVKEQGSSPPKSRSALSRQEALRLLHELRVHQIELRMQNDELSRTRAELSAARERYFDLYNLAPVGYFIVSHEGRILETNLAGTNLLKVARATLVKQPITRFILKEDQDVYYFHRKELLATGRAHTCDLRMVKADGTVFWVRLTATPEAPLDAAEPGGAPMSRVVLSEISGQKQTEQTAGPKRRRGKAGSAKKTASRKR